MILSRLPKSENYWEAGFYSLKYSHSVRYNEGIVKTLKRREDYDYCNVFQSDKDY